VDCAERADRRGRVRERAALLSGGGDMLTGKQLGCYRVLDHLGSGGMGSVYLATRGADRVALKVFHTHLLEKPGFFERFQREALAGMRVNHLNVVRTLDCAKSAIDGQDYHYLVMEYTEGTTLCHTLEDLGRLSESWLLEIAAQVGAGLRAIHDGDIVHRDLKPENILITKTDEIKIMDLGVALLSGEALRLSSPGQFVGSVLYASPEQFTCAGGDVDCRADLYSLGLILYELASGDLPCYEGGVVRVIEARTKDAPRRLSEIGAQVSPFFDEVVQTLLAHDREERIQSAQELLDILELGEASDWWVKRSRGRALDAVRPPPRIIVARETAVHGRGEDLTQLRRLFDEACEGQGHVVILDGEAGSGKTRLLDELTTGLQEDGVELNFLYGVYPPGGAATASGALCSAFREHLGSEGLERSLKAHLSGMPGLIPAFAAVLRGEPAPQGHMPLDRDATQTAFVQLGRSLAADRPTLIVIDDLHLAPEEGLALFASLACAVPGHRILLVGATRPGVSDSWIAGLTRLEHVLRQTVDRLDPQAVAGILAEHFGSNKVAQLIGPRVATWSDGNALFVFEILHGLQDGGFLVRRPNGAWTIWGDADHFEIPTSIQDQIQARFSLLDDDARALVDVAACAGFRFDPVLVGEALELGPIAVLRRLGQLNRVQRLVHPSEKHFVFDHHLVREALYESLSDGLRERYHAALAGALENRMEAATRPAESLDGGLLVDLCDHFLRGGLGARAVKYLDAALDHLEQNGLSAPALALAERMLEPAGILDAGDRAALLLRASEHLGIAGRSDAQRTRIEEAMQLAETVGDDRILSRAHRLMGIHHLTGSRNEQGGEHVLEAIRLAREANDPDEEVSAMIQHGNLLAEAARFAEARKCFEEAYDLADENGNLASAAAAIGSLGNVCTEDGRPEEAIEHGRHCLEIFAEIGDRIREVKARGLLGNALVSLGRRAEAREVLEEQVDKAREIGYRRGEAMATGNLGLVCFAEGRPGDALESYAQELEIQDDMDEGDPQIEAHDAARVAAVQALIGRNQESLDLATRAVTIYTEIGDRRNLAFARQAMGVALARLGDAEGAEKALGDGIEILESVGDRRELGPLLVDLGRIVRRLDQADRAAACFERAREVASETGHRTSQVLALAHLAWLGRGDANEAAKMLEEHEPVIGVPEQMEINHVLWKSTGSPAYLEEARRILLLIRANAPEIGRASIMTEVPLHGDILADGATGALS
jgi:tetratricopeptide (TPR) repeat protein